MSFWTPVARVNLTTVVLIADYPSKQVNGDIVIHIAKRIVNCCHYACVICTIRGNDCAYIADSRRSGT